VAADDQGRGPRRRNGNEALHRSTSSGEEAFKEGGCWQTILILLGAWRGLGFTESTLPGFIYKSVIAQRQFNRAHPVNASLGISEYNCGGIPAIYVRNRGGSRRVASLAEAETWKNADPLKGNARRQAVCRSSVAFSKKNAVNEKKACWKLTIYETEGFPSLERDPGMAEGELSSFDPGGRRKLDRCRGQQFPPIRFEKRNTTVPPTRPFLGGTKWGPVL